MAKGHQAKLKKSDTSPSKKSTKTKTVDSVQDKHAVISHAKCIDCKCVIMDDTRALNCERCAVNWKCSGCVGMDLGKKVPGKNGHGKKVHGKLVHGKMVH